jgi:exodeoxyribonuclease VII large subunit
MNDELVFGVSDFVAVVNQTLEFAYPYVSVEGELSNFRVSKNRWVYFDLKDENATLRCFGTVYMLPGPLEDGMVVRVSGNPRLHPHYNFSLTVQTMRPVGEGALHRAADLLAAKLQAEGLFDPQRKRTLPYPPRRVALVTAGSSAAYADFMKILNARWRGVDIDHYDVLVQGEQAPAQIVQAVSRVNALAEPPDVLVLVRGGGSAEDLATFNTEAVCRAVAASRVPTLVAIGHEVDISLAELAADQRASTPSNAAELLVPDRRHVLEALHRQREDIRHSLIQFVGRRQEEVKAARTALQTGVEAAYDRARERLRTAGRLLEAYSPEAALRRGYVLVRVGGHLVTSVGDVQAGTELAIQLQDGTIDAKVVKIQQKEEHYAKRAV